MTAATEAKTLPRLKQKYRSEVIAALQEQYKYGNPMQVPGLVKVVVNMGVGEAARDAKLIDGAVRDLTTITGQKPLVRRATKSIAQFKLREGMPIGAKVTLRNDRMWEFLDRLLSIALPRIRDFRGLDGRKLDRHDRRGGPAAAQAPGLPVQGELSMAKKALIIKAAAKPKFAVRAYTRCQKCG